ncbi:hypothetical protein Tco_0149418 [Tanacetum coccineum]
MAFIKCASLCSGASSETADADSSSGTVDANSSSRTAAPHSQYLCTGQLASRLGMTTNGIRESSKPTRQKFASTESKRISRIKRVAFCSKKQEK